MDLNYKLLTVMTGNVMIAICFGANSMIRWTAYGFDGQILVSLVLAFANIWIVLFTTFNQFRMYAEFVTGKEPT